MFCGRNVARGITFITIDDVQAKVEGRSELKPVRVVTDSTEYLG
jgi:hypothetical protein